MSPPLNPTEVQSRTDGRATLFNFDQFALPIRSIAGLAQIQEPGGSGGEAGSRRGLGQMMNEPIAVVRKYVDAFNRGDATAMAMTFAGSGAILDGMPPHVWQGPTATQDWYRGVLVEGKQHDVSDYFITLGEPRHNNVTGDSAYVVFPATMTFKLRGEQVMQSGAVFTVGLRKLSDGWRIAAWAWAKGT